MVCIFCKIINKESPSDVVFEDETVLAFKNINPIAPVHILVIPKRHISSVVDIKIEDTDLMGKLIFVAKKLACDFGVSQTGYKILIRVGKDGGQEIQHIHLHLIGGKKLTSLS
ncbi:MAG: histidine triad nucleotide-binding protein [Candidatus Pacebacteria bacterium]|nr:histidine triad nucleotide-binding protein [Candidatus Paceibacterota bacterium]